MKFKQFFKSNKRIVLLLALILFPVIVLASHELSVVYLQDKTCVICHEMKDPIEKWKASGTAKNHGNCAKCHFDSGFDGWMHMNKSALRFLVEHFDRDPLEPIKPKEEPLFLEEGNEPGYWSHVPNSRCFSCKNVENHQQRDQVRIHNKLIKNIASQPCKDCHNHEMRNGQKFYEKITSQESQAG